MIVQGLAVLLLVYRLLIMVLVEFAIIDAWPLLVTDDYATKCAATTYPEYCKWNCELRRDWGMDTEGMREYLAIDPVVGNSDLTFRANIFVLVVVTTPLITFAVLGLLFRKLWAAKIGLFVSGMYFAQMCIYFAAIWVASSNPLKVYSLNMQDMIFALLVGWWSWTRIQGSNNVKAKLKTK